MKGTSGSYLETFYGHARKSSPGRWDPYMVPLKGARAAVEWANKYRERGYQEVRVTDAGDLFVLHIVDGVLIWPE